MLELGTEGFGEKPIEVWIMIRDLLLYVKEGELAKNYNWTEEQERDVKAITQALMPHLPSDIKEIVLPNHKRLYSANPKDSGRTRSIRVVDLEKFAEGFLKQAKRSKSRLIF